MEKSISVIVPCRNESQYIEDFLESLIRQDIGFSKIELLVIDGLSTDGTLSILKKFQHSYPSIRIITNEMKHVSSSLNLGITHSTGDVIIRMDVHCIYPINYISTLIKYLNNFDVDNVGCVVETTSKSSDIISKSIAICLTSPIGVGNSLFRIGVSKPTYTDTVPFGCFHRSIFDKIGYFDEDLIRNQDDEFNARIKKNGGKILLLPDVKIKYFPRSNIKDLFKMYFQYGYYKNLVNIKIKKITSIRQLIPFLFVLFLVSIPLIWLLDLTVLYKPYLVILVLYMSILSIEAYRLSTENRNFKLLIFLPLVFFTLHFSYGLGFLSSFIVTPKTSNN